jgi:hypothetical protein
VGSKIDFPGDEAQFVPDAMTVKVDGTLRDAHIAGDILG